jgi:membrane protease YdiL (CAAX protease family)
MKRHFFRRHQGRGSYDLFSSYNHFLPGFRGMLILLLLFAAGALIGNLVTLGIGLIFGQDFTQEYGMLFSYPVMFLPPILYASVQSRLNEYSSEGIALDMGGFGWKVWMTLIFTGIFSTIAAAFVVEPLASLLPQMPQWLEDTMEAMLENTPVWATLISVSIFAPLFEEWLCRGLVLRGLLHSSLSPFSAIAVSAAFFAILHMNPWQAVPAFCLGLLFGYVYYRTGSLKLTMLMHCTNNTIAVILSRVPQFEKAETFMDILSPWAYWSVFAACILILCCSLIIFRNSTDQVTPSC